MVSAGSLMSSIYPFIHQVWECGILGPWAGEGKASSLDACKPCHMYNSCSKYPPKNFSLSVPFSPGGDFEVTTNTNPSNFIPLAFSAQPWGWAQRRRPVRGKLQSYTFLMHFYTIWSAFSFSSLFPTTSNLCLAVLFSPPKLTPVGNCHAWQSIAASALRSHSWGSEWWGCMLHPLTHVSGSLCCLKCWWQRLIHNCPSLLPRQLLHHAETHLTVSMRQLQKYP